MNSITCVIGVSALGLAVATGTAYADSGKTREQVQAQLQAAWMAGDVPVGEGGLTPREMYPGQYPAVQEPPGKTRAQVRAELDAAIRHGDVPLIGLATPREDFPADYPAAPAPAPGMTRQQARAELDAAIRAGIVPPIGLTTPREEFPAHYPMVEPARAMAHSGSTGSAN